MKLIKNAAQQIVPAFEENAVVVAMACSDYFLPYAAVTLQSLLDCSCRDNRYDIVLLHTDITKQKQDLLLRMVSLYSNVRLRYINVESLLSQHCFIVNNHVSVETFYRLFTGELFKRYKKVVYLDSDLIILRDVAELFETDIGSCVVAAVLDADHAGAYRGRLSGVRQYTDKVLQLQNPYRYFQAGVMVFNIAQYNCAISQDELLQLADSREYMFVDQDILNIVCHERVFFLDMKWNVMTGNYRKKYIISLAPINIRNQFARACKDPFILHYAGARKPWQYPQDDFAECFWERAQHSIFYEDIAEEYERFCKDLSPSGFKTIIKFVGRNTRHLLKKFILIFDRRDLRI